MGAQNPWFIISTVPPTTGISSEVRKLSSSEVAAASREVRNRRSKEIADEDSWFILLTVAPSPGTVEARKLSSTEISYSRKGPRNSEVRR